MRSRWPARSATIRYNRIAYWIRKEIFGIVSYCFTHFTCCSAYSLVKKTTPLIIVIITTKYFDDQSYDNFKERLNFSLLKYNTVDFVIDRYFMTLCKTTDIAALQEIFGFGLPNVWIVRPIGKFIKTFCDDYPPSSSIWPHLSYGLVRSKREYYHNCSLVVVLCSFL